MLIRSNQLSNVEKAALKVLSTISFKPGQIRAFEEIP
jgi:hypothetical protein